MNHNDSFRTGFTPDPVLVRHFLKAMRLLEQSHRPQRVTVDELEERLHPEGGRLFIVDMLHHLALDGRVERASLMHWRTGDNRSR